MVSGSISSCGVKAEEDAHRAEADVVAEEEVSTAGHMECVHSSQQCETLTDGYIAMATLANMQRGSTSGCTLVP